MLDNRIGAVWLFGGFFALHYFLRCLSAREAITTRLGRAKISPYTLQFL